MTWLNIFIKKGRNIVCFSDIIRYNSDKNGSKIALIQDDLKITYSKLYREICNLTSFLHKKNIKEDDNVIIYLPNSLEFVLSFFAFTNLGCTVCLIDIKLTNELSSILCENNVSYLITNKDYITKIRNKSDNTNIVDISDLIVKTRELINHYENEQCNESNKTSIILYTSGSEGRPKPVRNSFTSIYSALCCYRETVPITNEDILVGVVPFYHSYGFGSCFLEGLACGATVILMPQFIPSKFIAILKKYEVTVFHGVPYMYKLLIEL